MDSLSSAFLLVIVSWHSMLPSHLCSAILRGSSSASAARRLLPWHGAQSFLEHHHSLVQGLLLTTVSITVGPPLSTKRTTRQSVILQCWSSGSCRDFRSVDLEVAGTNTTDSISFIFTSLVVSAFSASPVSSFSLAASLAAFLADNSTYFPAAGMSFATVTSLPPVFALNHVFIRNEW